MSDAVVFAHHRIRTLDHPDAIDGGIAVRDGIIVHIGTLSDARAAAGPGAREIRLPGEALLPGFHDAHIHALDLAASALGPDVNDAESHAEVLEMLREYGAEHPGDGWVVGGRYDANRWSDAREPHRDDLDAIFGDRPVQLWTVDGHASWVNTAALAAAKVSADTPDPVGGTIVRDGSGEPTGLLLESASDLVGSVADDSALADPVALLDGLQDDLLRLGITQITDLDGEDARAAFAQLHASGRLRVRVRKGVQARDLETAIDEGRRSGDGDDWLSTGPVKFFSDGALGPHTAHFHDDFVGEPGNRGIEVTPFEQLAEGVRRCVDAGLSVAVHAIGDRANTLVLDAFEMVSADARQRGLQLRIEHAQHLRPADIHRFAELGVIASMQPTHCTSDYPLSVQLLGERETLHYPWRTLLDRRAPLAFGSDSPVEPANPWFGIHAAVTRQREDGEPAGGREPEERITLTEALRAYTLGAAEADGHGDRVGALRVGMLADWITVDRDPFEIPAEELREVQTVTAVVGGVVRFEG